MGAIRYSCSIRLIPTFTLPAIEIRLLGRFCPCSFKATDRQTDMARSRLVMLIKNIYALCGRKRLFYCIANFWLKSLYPLQSSESRYIKKKKMENSYATLLKRKKKYRILNLFFTQFWTIRWKLRSPDFFFV